MEPAGAQGTGVAADAWPGCATVIAEDSARASTSNAAPLAGDDRRRLSASAIRPKTVTAIPIVIGIHTEVPVTGKQVFT